MARTRKTPHIRQVPKRGTYTTCFYVVKDTRKRKVKARRKRRKKQQHTIAQPHRYLTRAASRKILSAPDPGTFITLSPSGTPVL